MSTAITDKELETRHRALWALGNYRAIADEVVAGLGPEVVAAANVRRGERVLDIATGTGNAALAAAAGGADVTAIDLCPELLEQGRELAVARGLATTFIEANAEALPFENGQFDVVLSCIGVMFAPHHHKAADELVRVCRSGGRIAVLNWTPDGFIGRLFATMKPYMPAPPPGAQPPPLWGDEDHVRQLLGNRVTDVQLRLGNLTVDHFADGAAFRDYFKAHYGPTITAYRGIGDDSARAAALDADLAALGDDALAGSRAMDWQYLIVMARRC